MAGATQRRLGMRKLHVGENIAVFILFFGLALMEAMQHGRWLLVVLWLALAAVFLRADNLRPHQH
jgi:hypothetical protein